MAWPGNAVRVIGPSYTICRIADPGLRYQPVATNCVSQKS